MKRSIIRIDEKKCTGCGLCIPNCPEGAIQIIDEKARLISDIFCDGLGACIGHCPEEAITVEEREAEPYDEKLVMSNIVPQGPNTIKAHLDHLRDHDQKEFLGQALEYLEENNIVIPVEKEEQVPTESLCGCPGSRTMAFTSDQTTDTENNGGTRPSRLTHWPIQMHLISPMAPHFKGADLLLSADCVAFSLGEFHRDYLNGKTLAIACPKLDANQEVYVEKIKAMIDSAQINSLTVAIMQVPCCSGLLHLARQAAELADRNIPINCVVVGVEGGILQEERVQ
jgi:ferredoxin